MLRAVARQADTGVTDGDKGDISVSSSGTVWTVDDESITYAKMQHTSGTDVLLGRSTAGAGDVEEITCTAFARSLLDDADAASVRSTIGVDAAGTDNSTNVTLAGAYNYLTISSQEITLGQIDLTTDVTGALPIANVGNKSGSDGTLVTGTAGTNGNVAIWNGDGDVVDGSVAAANILVDADIGGAVQAYDADTAKTDVAQEYTKQQNFNATTLTDAASISWNLDDNQVAAVTLGGNRTLSNPTNMKDGATYILRVVQDGTGSRTLAYGANYKWPGGTAPTLTTTASAVDILTFVSDGTNMYGVAQLNFS